MLTKPDVLDEDAVPEHEVVVHRQEELRRLRNATRSGADADLAYLLGPPGTGKTMSARLQADKLSRPGSNQVAYVNCWQQHDRYDVLFTVTDALTDDVIHRSSTGRGALLDRLADLDDTARWVICDEADQLREHEVLYDLVELEGVNLIAIANSETDLFNGMDERLQSRLAVGRRIEFEPYTAAELSEILAKRAEYAFRDPSVVDGRQLDWIAERVDGDARRAIRALREAVTIAIDAEGRRQPEIRDADLEAALPRAIQTLQRKAFEDLLPHQQTLHEILLEEGALPPKELHERYTEAVDDPRSQRTMRDYLSKMEHYEFVRTSGSTRDRVVEAIPIE